MRTIGLIAISCLSISSTGCVSATIAESGRNLSSYQTRVVVQKALGPPIATSYDTEHTFDDFRFQGKVREQGSAQGAMMVGAFTLGLSELIVLPTMLADLPRELRETHDVRYFYDEEAEVVRYEETGGRLRPDHEGSRRPGPWELLPCAQDIAQNSFAEIGAILKFPLITL
jgi:hypothetical protein